MKGMKIIRTVDGSVTILYNHEKDVAKRPKRKRITSKPKSEEYSDNQIKAIKKIQWLSRNDSEFQENIGSSFTFDEVVTSGFWSLDQLERAGQRLSDPTKRYCFIRHNRLAGSKHPRRKMQRIPSKHQFENKARSLNKRDGVKNIRKR